MRNVSAAYRQLLYKNKRNYENTLLITLADGTKLTVTNEHIMDGGYDIDDAVGDDGNFSALGSTIVNSCEVTLYNNDEIYSDYDFINAKVVIKTNLIEASASDELQLGVYTVDEPTYGESTITLKLLDNMCQFDREYTSQNIYGSQTTLFTIVSDACTKCGVLYAPTMTNFPNKNFVVPSAPKDNTTYREVIGWCATIAGCFARCDNQGRLEFAWFNTDAFDAVDTSSYDGGIFDPASPYATGDNVNGGTFNPWNDPTSVDGGAFTTNNHIHYIYPRTLNIAVDDVVITGIQITYDVENNNSNEAVTKLRGTDDYIINIKDNPFINANNYESVFDFLAPQLIGLQFRACNITNLNDPTIEAGDVAYIWDTKGAQHRTLITRVTFNPAAPQTIVCGAESVGKNSSARLADTVTKAFRKSRRELNEEKSLRQLLEEDLNDKIANSPGLYKTEVPKSGGGTDIYYHNLPELEESDIRILISTAGITVTANGTDASPTWYGLTVDGNYLANILSAYGVDADWITTGTISSRDNTVQIDLDNNTINIKGVTSFEGFATKTGLATAGYTTINGSNITTGSIKDANSNTVFNLSTGELTVKKGSINLGNGNFVVTSGGALTAKDATIHGTITAGDTTTANSFWTRLKVTGELEGYRRKDGSNIQAGFINFTANEYDSDADVERYGLKLHGRSVIRIEAPKISVATSSSGTGTFGYSGYVQMPKSIRSDGTVATWTNARFINGIYVD